MSRVFEALTKAAEAKQRQFDRSVEVESAVTVDTAPKVERQPPTSTLKQTGRSARRTEPFMKHVNYFHRLQTTKSRGGKKLTNGSLGGFYSVIGYPIVALETESPASEQYKMLREQIKRLRFESGIKSFSISSPVKGDGKTTVAVNLAASLSLDYEKKVLLIDGDLRAPSVHRYFNTPESPGLSDYLASDEKMNLRKLLQDTFVPELRIMPSGKPSNLASELLAKDRMKQLMEEAQVEFPGHHIIIDSPLYYRRPTPW